MKARTASYWRSLASGSSTSFESRLLLCLLLLPSLLYAWGQRLRAVFYRLGMLPSRKLPCPVVSVGNLSVGGTGKTPVTAWIASHLIRQGCKVVVLSRGYGGAREGQIAVVSDGREVRMTPEECGDEPFLLATRVPGLVVVIGSDRHAAGMLAMREFKPDLFLLDDGFQHLQLQRDLNLVLLDHDRPFGNGWTLPAGILREPRQALHRADLILMTRSPATPHSLPPLPGRPTCHARHEICEAVPLCGGDPLPLTALQGCSIAAFAGIAEPQLFFDDLLRQGLKLVATLVLPDHVQYDTSIVATLRETIRSSGADLLLTTEKDGVKLRHLPEDLARQTLLARLRLTLSDPAPLTLALRNLLQK